MTDWADEIANGFCSVGLMDAGQVLASDKSPEHYAAATNLRRDREASERKQLASALRAAELRGRVAGMRETIALLEKCGNGECLYHVEEIEAAATKLESPPTT